METGTKFFIHKQGAGEFGGSRRDLAVVYEALVTAVFTLGVENGGTVGADCLPFEKGKTIHQAFREVAKYNRAPEGAVCACGTTETNHTRSAKCESGSRIWEIGLYEAVRCCLTAKRPKVGVALLRCLRQQEMLPLKAFDEVDLLLLGHSEDVMVLLDHLRRLHRRRPHPLLPEGIPESVGRFVRASVQHNGVPQTIAKLLRRFQSNEPWGLTGDERERMFAQMEADGAPKF